MEDKPKKVLSDEQLKKMQEGRKIASEKRKLAKEQSKDLAKKKTAASKKSDKSELLNLELEALAQQQDKINNLKMQVDRKREVKSKLKSIKDEVIEDNDELEVVEEEVEEKEEVEEVKEEKEDDNKKYEFTFKEEAKRLRENIDPSAHKYYDNAVNKFDYTLSLDDNIKSMIEYVKNVVDSNVQLATKIKEEKEIVDTQEEILVKNITPKETLVEKQIQSQINRLMKMKY